MQPLKLKPAVILLSLLTIVSCKKITDTKISTDKSNKGISLLAVQTGGSITVDIGNPKQKIDLMGAGCYFYSGHLVNLANFNTAAT
ncbi:hypothetical protein [Ferruginibacter sp.]|uniref:hypothetical protein n=1 Tax=Ferruginibacter sp. TaxID=1940288 RepID=UPI00265B288B|nr:hypothetical protein [Ferruginibacter sp.]